jgi:hypothetical protein
MFAINRKLRLLILCAVLLAIYGPGQIARVAKAYSGASAVSSLSSQKNIPSFLEKGKSYHFNFVVGFGEYVSPVSMTARVEKIEEESGWVYIQHYNTVRKGKGVEYHLSGYSWINFRHVYQCSEAVINP